MKRLLSFVFISLVSLIVLSQTSYVYKSNSQYDSDIVYTYSNGKLYEGKHMYKSHVKYTYANGKLYIGDNTYSQNIIATYKNGKIYKGNSTYEKDCVGKINCCHLYYKKDGYYIPVITIENGKVYKGKTTYSSNIIMNYKGNLPPLVICLTALNIYRYMFNF